MGVKLPVTVREEHRLRVFENRLLRRLLGPNRKWCTAGEDCIISLQQILLG
jgi:hypothetical protein